MKEAEASSTALLVAASLSYLARDARLASAVPEEARILGDWLLRHYSRLTRTSLACLDQFWFRAVIRTLERNTVPQIVEHYAARKQALEKLFREENSVGRLIVLGAGFDTLALRLLRELPELDALEIDHPATQAWKTKAVAACDYDSPRLAFLPQDLSLSSNPQFPRERSEKNTFWVAEGLLMYFSPDRVEALFRRVHQASTPGSRFAFTFMEVQQNGRIDFRRSSRGLHLWLNHRQEPFSWGISRRELSSFLARLGFRLLDIPDRVTHEIDRLDVGEYLALAEVCPEPP